MTTVMTNDEEKILSFLITNFQLEASQVDVTTPLFDSGVLDSMGFVELVDFIEREYSVTFSDDELQPEGFGSVSEICKRIASHSG
jgi:D-alanine--poly(phosphoribitol) ligase subunit 2